MNKTIDPNNPKCPDCDADLSIEDAFSSIRYDDIKATMYVMMCPCGAATGLVLMDEHDPNDPYVVQKVDRS